MRKIKILALVLAVAMLFPLLVACGGGDGATTSKKPSGNNTTTTKGQDDGTHWSDGVDFDKQKFVIDISVNQDTEQTFPAADKYTRGPDSLTNTSDEVEKKIFNRNAEVARRLNLDVSYTETDVAVGNSLEIIEKYFLAADAPDVFNNDQYDIIHAMLLGYLWNVLDPTVGDEVYTSYFDFTHECWRWDFMEGTTMDPQKVYAVAGDYFIDLVRFSFVIYVNNDLFNSTFQDVFGDIIMLYGAVQEGEWDYAALAYYIENGFRDTGTTPGVADKEDSVVGLASSTLMERSFSWTNGLSVVQKNEKTGTWEIPETNQQLTDFASKYSDMYNTTGLYRTSDVLEATTLFLNGNVLFTVSMLGEMESDAVRGTDFKKGILPIPKYDMELQDKYHTLVHDQAEVGCILGNAKDFTASSAYLQLINELSVEVLQEYYETNLKVKLVDNKETREMIDLVHDNIDSPFDSILGRHIVSGSFIPGATTGDEIYNMVQNDAANQTNTFASTYANNLNRWRSNLNILLKLFNDNLE